MVEWLVYDVRYAVRGIRRSPLFAASVAATIGLGLGILCSAFTILNAYLLRPIDLPDAHQLYSLSWDTETTQRRRLTLADFDDVRQDAPPFSGLVASREVLVMRHLEQMDNDDRELLIMRHVEQLSNSQVADILGLSQPAAGMHGRSRIRLSSGAATMFPNVRRCVCRAVPR